jgi:hypothetical protein
LILMATFINSSLHSILSPTTGLHSHSLTLISTTFHTLKAIDSKISSFFIILEETVPSVSFKSLRYSTLTHLSVDSKTGIKVSILFVTHERSKTASVFEDNVSNILYVDSQDAMRR